MSLTEKYGDLDVFYAADYSQLEIRILAQMSQDPLLLKLISSGEDLHSAVGHELTGESIKKIRDDRETRTTIKGLHFGIIYGLSATSLYFDLKVKAAKAGETFTKTKEEVTSLYNKYFKKFTGVKQFIDEQVAIAEEKLYVSTMFGFQREISPAGDEDRDTFWKNQAVNTPIQGTAHQLMLIALAITHMKKQTYDKLQRLCMEIHDSLVAYTSVRDLPETHKQMMFLMETDVINYVKKLWPQLDWQVPLKAEGKAGFRLGVLVKEYQGGDTEEFLNTWCKENKKFDTNMMESLEKMKAGK